MFVSNLKMHVVFNIHDLEMAFGQGNTWTRCYKKSMSICHNGHFKNTYNIKKE